MSHVFYLDPVSGQVRSVRRCVLLAMMIVIAVCRGPAVASSVSANAVSQETSQVKRPNILFIFADDWGRFAGIYSEADGRGGVNDIIPTPNFDRIARDGVLFRNAFVNAPSCTPCRSSLLSGQYFWRTGRGAILQGAVWDPKIPVWPLMLKDSGYHIGKSFKVWSPGIPADAPFGGHQNAYQSSGGRFNQFSQFVTDMVAKGSAVEAAKQVLLDETAGNFRSFLKLQNDEQPFCYWFGPTNVHRKWVRGSGKALWGLEPDDLKGKMPPFLPEVPEVREDLADYLGEVMALDAGIGVLLNELKQSGEYDNTLIVISGDHGAPGFPHGKCNLYDFGTAVSLAISGPGVKGGRVVDDFVSLPDLAPTFLETAGVAIPEVMTAKSLWPVLHSAASGQVDPARTWVITGRERHVEMARAGHLPYPQRGLRTADFLYIINFRPERNPLGDPYNLTGSDPPTKEELTETTFVTFPDDDAGPTKAWLVGERDNPQWKAAFDLAYGPRPREELYDLKSDPHQMTNVAADERYASARRKLESQLMQELQQSGDPRLIDDGSFFETPPMAGPLPADSGQPNRERKPKKNR